MGLENPIHLAILLMVLLMVFGAKRLPEMGRSLGDGLRGFKEAVSGQAPPQTLVQAETPQTDASVTTPVAASIATPVVVPTVSTTTAD